MHYPESQKVSVKLSDLLIEVSAFPLGFGDIWYYSLNFRKADYFLCSVENLEPRYALQTCFNRPAFIVLVLDLFILELSTKSSVI